MSHTFRTRLYGHRQHEERETERRQRRTDRLRPGAPVDDARTRFATYRVRQDQLPPARRAHERTDAITHARGQAMGAGLRVVDVCRADYQDNGDWLVELRVETAA